MEQRQNCSLRMIGGETSLTVPWLRLWASTLGSIPRWGVKTPHAVWCSQKKTQKKNSSWLNLIWRIVQDMFCLKLVLHTDCWDSIFIWKPLPTYISLCDIALINLNAFDLMSNWVIELTVLQFFQFEGVLWNSLSSLVAFLVYQNNE